MKKKMGSVIAIVIMLISIMTRVESIDNEEEILKQLNAEIDQNLISTKYLVTDDTIGRIRPETKVAELKAEWEDETIKIYKDQMCQEEVVEGNVGTGMLLKVEGWEKVYEISVIGDLNKDGIANQIELSKIIREVKEIPDCRLEGINRISADITGDGKIDEIDVKKLINYIVFGELNVDPIPEVKSPKVEVVSGEEKNGYYISDVGIKITEENTEEIAKTVYKITGSKETDPIEIENGGIINLTEDGIYKISSYTYGKLGNRSKANSVIIKIQKPIQVGYKVEHYKEELNGSYKLAETEELNGISDTQVTAIAKTYEGFMEDTENENRIATGTINRDGSLTLKLYYNRNTYQVTLNKDENIESVSLNNLDVATGNYKYGETVSVNAILKEETGYTYIWNKWVSSDSNLIADNSNKEATFEMPAGNITLTATGTKRSNINHINYVLYDKDNVINNEQNPIEYQMGIGVDIESLTDTIQTTIERENMYTYGEEYLFKGWYENENYEGESITRIDSTKTGDITLYAKWGKVVAKIVETGELYTTLDEAIKICEANGEKRTIQILEDIEESGIIINGQNITIDLNGKTISSNNEEATIINYGTLQVIDNSTEKTGRIENTTNVAIKNSGELILGDNEGTVETVPVIEGETYGIKNNGIFNFYDGSVIGIAPLKGDITETPENYSPVVNQEENKQKATLGIMSDAEARIGSYYYTQLEKALEEAKNGETVVLLQNKNLSDKITIASQKEVVIDLNSHNIVTTYDGNAIENNGKLEIIDSSEEQQGTIYAINGNTILNNEDALFKISSGTINAPGGTSNNRYSVIYNLGNVEIAGGTVYKNSSYGYAIDNYGKSLTISGGTVKSSSNAIRNNYENQVTITGGTVSASYAIYNNQKGNINILGTSKITGTIYNNNEGIINLCGDNISVGEVRNESLGTINQSTGIVQTIRNTNKEGYVNITGGTTNYITNSGITKIINATVISISNSKTMEIIDSNASYVTNEADMKIANCEMNSTSTNAAITNSGNITMKDTKINTKGNGIDNKANGVINIDSCIITSSDQYGINNVGTLVLGEKENTQSSEESIITGKTYGVYNLNQDNVVFKYYKGVIKGQTAIYGYVDDVPTNQSILFTTEDSLEIARLGIQEQNIVEIDGVGYKTLQAAINTCGEQQKTITVIRDFNITSEEEIATINSEKNIILDLNGHNILSYKKEKNIDNAGNLIISDSNVETIGMIKNAIIRNVGIIDVTNGNLYYDITSGMFIDNLDGSEFKLSNGTINIASNSITGIYAESGSTVEIAGGKVSLNDSVYSSTAIKGDVGSNIKVTGGTIETSCSYNSNVTIYSEGKVVINGGTIISKSYSDRNLIGIAGAESKLEINGGTITNNQINNNNGNIEITGGTIECNYFRSNTGAIISNMSSQEVNVKITGGTIRNTYNYYDRGTVIKNYYYTRETDSKINVEITGGLIESSNGYGIYNMRSDYNGTTNVKITGGTIKGGGYGIYNGEGTVTLGENDETVSTETPEISGGTYGVYNEGVFNFYDGIIKGSTNAIYGATENIADEREIVKTIQDSVEIAVLQEITPVARVKESEYTDLQEAINSCEEKGEIITILKDFEGMASDESYIVDGNKDIIIDLNGKNITYANEYMIKNSGKLEIKDSTDESKGQITGKTSSFIDNLDGAEFKLSSGTINIASNSTTGIYAESGSTVEIAGGKVSLNDSVYSSTAIKGDVGSNIKVTGGTIETSCSYNSNVTIYSEGKVVINGGTIISKSYSDRNLIGIAGAESKLEINGGTITNNQINNNNGNIEITGGTIECNYFRSNTGAIISNMSSQEVNVKITGGTIRNTYNYYDSGTVIKNYYYTRETDSKINVEITGGLIESSNGYGIYNMRSNYNGTTNVKITGGTIKGGGYGIYNQKGIVTLGENDETVSTEIPSISGGTYGVYNEDVFNFYDGIIKGGTNAIYGAVENIADDREIVKTIQDSVEIAVLQEITPVARVNETEYTDLQEAINSCEEKGEIITILKDFDGKTSDESYIVDGNKEIIIDINGKNITHYNEYMIKNSGKLEIRDSSEGEEGKITGTNSTFIDNLEGSEFKLSSGTINIASLSTTGIYAESGSTVEIAGGKVSLNNGINSSIAVKGDKGSNIKVTGGTIESSCHLNSNRTIYSEGKVVIDGGTIKSPNNADRNVIGVSGADSKLEINGGNIVNNVISNYAGSVEITGGSIETTGYYSNTGIVRDCSIITNTASNDSQALIKITGGTIINKVSGGSGSVIYNMPFAQNSEIKVEITGGTIESNSKYGIYNEQLNGSSGVRGTTNVTITGGTIKGGTYGIYNPKGTVTLGENDGNVSTEAPTISGGTYGVYNQSVFNFYDGIIKGSTSSISGVITTIPQGYKVDTSTNNGEQTSMLKIIPTDEAVIKIGSIYYMDLQTAINSCVDGEETTITLLKNIELELDITISSEKSVKLDINGKKIDGKELYHIINNGMLTIIDSTGGDISEVEKLVINNVSSSNEKVIDEVNAENESIDQSIEIDAKTDTKKKQEEKYEQRTEENITEYEKDTEEETLESEKNDKDILEK